MTALPNPILSFIFPHRITKFNSQDKLDPERTSSNQDITKVGVIEVRGALGKRRKERDSEKYLHKVRLRLNLPQSAGEGRRDFSLRESILWECAPPIKLYDFLLVQSARTNANSH